GLHAAPRVPFTADLPPPTLQVAGPRFQLVDSDPGIPAQAPSVERSAEFVRLGFSGSRLGFALFLRLFESSLLLQAETEMVFYDEADIPGSSNGNAGALRFDQLQNVLDARRAASSVRER